MARKFKLILIIIFINFSSCAKNTIPQIPEDILKAALNLPQSSSEATLATNVSPILAPNIPTPSNLAANNENQPNESVNQETKKCWKKSMPRNFCLLWFNFIWNSKRQWKCFIRASFVLYSWPCFNSKSCNNWSKSISICQWNFTKKMSFFVKKIAKISPEILQFATPEIRGSEIFMEQASYINRNAIKYASWKLFEIIRFLWKMIEIDSHNYQFASDRIKY